MNKRVLYITVFSLAILLRLAFVPNPGFEADVAFWKGWGLASADKGAVWSMLNTNNNYPTPFSYTLGAMVSLYRAIGGNPYDFNDYWSNTNTRFLFASKIFPILADVGIAILLIYIGKNPKRYGFPEENHTSKKKTLGTFLDISHEKLFLLLAILYLFNPVTIMDGAWWGQVDSLGVIFFLLSFLCVARNKLYLAGFIFMVAMMTKLQNMIYAPLLFTFVWQQYGFMSLLKAIIGALVGFVGLNIEFFLTDNKARILRSITDNHDYFPYMSLHAYNMWWIISNGNGMGVSDKLLLIGKMTAKSIGLILFIGSYLLSVLQITLPSFLPMLMGSYTKRKDQIVEQVSTLSEKAVERFFIGMSIVNAGFFLLLTQSHERYAFPLSAFLLMLVPFLKGKRRVLFVVGYSVISLLYFYNLHTAFAVNYPENVFSFLKGWFITSTPTMAVSYIFMASFVIFLFFFRKSITLISFLLSGGAIILLIVGGNVSFWQKRPQALSSFTPWFSTQQYGSRTKDMPVNGGFGPKSWTWLSTQYVFYRKGIGTHANSELRYDVAGRFNEFSTDFGIDTTAGTQASAIFEIWGDNQQLFVSPKMGRFDMPKHARVNIQGIKTLTLITRDAGDSNRDDHTNWLNPKLYP